MHQFIDFRGFKDVSIDLMRPFTLLIGPNGSGKTNVIEAIELLSFIARGQPLYEIADVNRTETGLQIRGGLQACGRLDRNTFLLGFSARTRFDGEIKPVTYRIHIRTKPHPQIQEEEFKVGNRVIYKTLAKNPWPEDLIVIYDNFARGGPKASSSSFVRPFCFISVSRNRTEKSQTQSVRSAGAKNHVPLASILCLRSKSKTNA